MTTIAKPTQGRSSSPWKRSPTSSRRRASRPRRWSNIVRLIQQRFETDVCSVYLIEPDRANLVLAATVGLRPESVGRVRMGLDEGLAGLVAEELRPIMVEDATKHPRFKYFREAGEEAVPLVPRRPPDRPGDDPGGPGGPDGRAAELLARGGGDAGRDRRPARADRQRGPHAREVHRPDLRADLGPGPELLVELGRRGRRACSTSSTRSAGASSTTTRSPSCRR